MNISLLGPSLAGARLFLIGLPISCLFSVAAQAQIVAFGIARFLG